MTTQLRVRQKTARATASGAERAYKVEAVWSIVAIRRWIAVRNS
jgi:hypothetical protein